MKTNEKEGQVILKGMFEMLFEEKSTYLDFRTLRRAVNDVTKGVNIALEAAHQEMVEYDNKVEALKGFTVTVDKRQMSVIEALEL